MSERMNVKQYRASRLKEVSEAEVQRDIRQHLKGRPYTITDATKSLNVHGQQVSRVAEFWPDITTISRDARMYCIEVKKPVGGRLSYGQALRARQLIQAGVLYCLARSVADVVAVEEAQSPTAEMLAEIDRVIRKGPKIDKGLAAKPIDERTGF